MISPAGVVDGLLADRYRLSARLGAGGMGEVWRADDVLLERVVAVKTLLEGRAADDGHRARFRAEARAAARLSHPGIAAVYDFGELPDRAWLVMELVEGEPLSTVLQREGTLDAGRTLDLVGQVAAALHAAHSAGVVHRDIKPGNLLLRRDGAVKVTDFGIASTAGAAPLTQTGQLVGTAGYVSPEQAGGGPASPSSDLYALGVVAHECLSGSRPFAAENPVAELLAHMQNAPPPLPDSVPAPVRDLVLRLLAKDPGERPTDARALGAEVRTAWQALHEHAVDDERRDRPAAGAAVPPASTLVLTDPYPDDAPRTGERQHAVPATPAPQATVPAPPVSPAPVPQGPDRRVRRHSSAVARRSSRRTQRWAVRLTALLLAVLAVGLGVGRTADDRGTTAPPADPAEAPTSDDSGGTAPDVPTDGVAPPMPAGSVGGGGGSTSPDGGTEDVREADDAADDGAEDAGRPEDGDRGSREDDGGRSDDPNDGKDDDRGGDKSDDKGSSEDKGKSDDKGKSEDKGKGGGP